MKQPLRHLLPLLAIAALPSGQAFAQAGTEYAGITIGTQKAATQPLPATLSVRDSLPPIGAVDPRILGIAYDWSEMNEMFYRKNLREPFIHEFSSLPLLLNRIGGAEGQVFRWKEAVGPPEQRSLQKLWSWQEPRLIECGPLEWIRTILDTRKEAEFVIAINLLDDSPEDHADLARMLLLPTGSPVAEGQTDWPALRAEGGLPEPVPVFLWELGNENDWRAETEAITPEDYIARCRAAIAAIRTIDPHARFAAHAGTAPHNTTNPRPYKGGWQVWHQQVLEALGDDIDYLVFHPYYNRSGVAEQQRFIAEIRRDIRTITGSDRIKLFFSEHATWPPEISKRENWYHSHSLHGSLLTGQFLIDQMHYPQTIASCWSMTAGPWGFFYPDPTNAQAIYTTGMFDLFCVLNKALGTNVLQSTLEGPRATREDHGTTFSAVAMQTDEGSAKGELRLVLVNREPLAQRDLELKFDRPYRLVEVTTLTADSLDSHNTANQRAISITSQTPDADTPLSHYTVPPKSLSVLRLLPL